jgi:hypothetical protein
MTNTTMTEVRIKMLSEQAIKELRGTAPDWRVLAFRGGISDRSLRRLFGTDLVAAVEYAHSLVAGNVEMAQIDLANGGDNTHAVAEVRHCTVNEVELTAACPASPSGDWHELVCWDGPCTACGAALMPEACEVCGDRDYELRDVSVDNGKMRVCPKCAKAHRRRAELELI